MNVEGMTWHAIVLDPEPFATTKALLAETFGLDSAVDTEGFVQFNMPNSTTLKLYVPQAVPDYGYNGGGVAFGFRVHRWRLEHRHHYPGPVAQRRQYYG